MFLVAGCWVDWDAHILKKGEGILSIELLIEVSGAVCFEETLEWLLECVSSFHFVCSHSV